MLSYLKSIVLYSLLFAVLVLLSEKFDFVKSELSEQYLLYQPNIGMNDIQFKEVMKYFGFKKKNKYVKKFDQNYKHLARLNDNSFILLLSQKCDLSKNETSRFPSSFIHLKRSKKYGFAVVEFRGPFVGHAKCILEKFNAFVRVEHQSYLEQEKTHLSNFISNADNIELKKMLIKKVGLLDSLMLLQPEGFLKYHFIQLKDSNVAEDVFHKSIYFSLLICLIALLIHTLFKKLVS